MQSLLLSFAGKIFFKLLYKYLCGNATIDHQLKVGRIKMEKKIKKYNIYLYTFSIEMDQSNKASVQ